MPASTEALPARRRYAAWLAHCAPPLLAVLSTWPLATHLREHVVLGPYESNTVSLTTEWTLWWNADRLAHGLRGYWDAPIFAPALGTFALSEPQPLSGLFFALPYAATGSLEVAYGLVVLLTLTLNGWATMRLLRRAGLGLAARTVGGAMATLLPFVHTELSVLPFITLSGAILALEAWLWFLDGPSAKRGALFGAALGASYLMTCQLTLLFVVILVLSLPFTVSREHLRPRTAAFLGVGALVCASMVAPLALEQLQITRTYHLERSENTVRDLSAGLNRYARPPYTGIVPFPRAKEGSSGRRWYFPGTLKLALAAAAIWLAVERRQASRLVRLALPLVVVSMFVGFGPLAHVGPLSLYGVLAAVVPGFRQIRGLFHVAAFAQLGVVLLAASAVDALRRSYPSRWSAAFLVVGALAAVELWPRGQRFATPPDFGANARWLHWITAHTPGDATIAFAPFPASGKVEAFEPTAEWMRFGTRFHRNIVNGYSSYFPDSNRRLAREMKTFPAPRSIEALRHDKVTILVVDRHHYDGPAPPLPRLFADEAAKIEIYGLPER